MSAVREIKKRIIAVKNIRKITGALHLISSVHLKNAQKILENFRPVYERMKEMVSLIPFEGWEIKERSVLIVISGDRGFDGGYNASVLEEAKNKVQELGKPVLLTVGKKAEKFFKERGFEVALNVGEISKKLHWDALEDLAEFSIEHFISGREIFVTYTRFTNPFDIKPHTERILPPKAATKEGFYFSFEPEPRELFWHIARFYFKVCVYDFLLNSFLSEQYLRTRAMETATENADNLIEELTLEFHKERKALITREIAEIVGAENLGGGEGFGR
ncbi:ATP synthase gamma chain [Fervidicola ferrireducens]|uniref:ATP synthase gamma chain n=1 Tax=Fervidicola ferrireducens TaxID=520764 RepID=A0A140LBN8_9FIRM|nr:FoF1 ATP synthase subunit gamma [Fervidicola ferrireducens]KXG77963.1 ATP synthase gamma chain [Fervidicola ferrireducens]